MTIAFQIDLDKIENIFNGCVSFVIFMDKLSSIKSDFVR
jgi:hypothetical protein